MTAIFRSLTPAALLLLSAPLTSCSEPAATLQCPKAQQGTSASVLRETPAGIAQAGEHLGRGSENEIGEEVAAIRAQHSGASQGAIINYLVTAYCPRIAANASLGRAEKQQAMQAFATRAGRIVQSR